MAVTRTLLYFAGSTGSGYIQQVVGSLTFSTDTGDVIVAGFLGLASVQLGDPTDSVDSFTKQTSTQVTQAASGSTSPQCCIYTILAPTAGLHTVTPPSIAGGQDGIFCLVKYSNVVSASVRTGAFTNQNGSSSQTITVTTDSTPAAADIAFWSRSHENSVGSTSDDKVTFTGSVGGATSGTLTASITNTTYNFCFSNGENRSVTVTSGTSCSWTGALSAGTITTAFVQPWTTNDFQHYTDGSSNLPCVFGDSDVQSAGVQTLKWWWTDTAITGTAGNVLVMTLVTGPTINTQPTDQTVNIGQTATFSVTATASSGSLSYQWQKWSAGSWSNVGTNSSSYTTGATGYSDYLTTYRVQVTDSNGTTNSVAATLHVTGTAARSWTKA
jgi:hypothetical protein